MGRIWMSQMGSTIADMGRQYFDRLGSNTMKEDTRRLCHDLLSGQGVASDTALAREIVTLFQEMERPDRGVNGQLPLSPRSNRWQSRSLCQWRKYSRRSQRARPALIKSV